MLVSADKTINIYKVEPSVYRKLCDETITKDYKKAKNNIVSKMVRDDKKLAEKLEIDDRVQKVTPNEAFISIKGPPGKKKKKKKKK